MTSIQVEIQAHSSQILERLFDKDWQQISSEDQCSIAQTGSTLKIQDYEPSESFGLMETFSLLMTIPAGVTINLISHWLLEKIHAKKDTIAITINGKTIAREDLTTERLTAVLEAMQ